MQTFEIVWSSNITNSLYNNPTLFIIIIKTKYHNQIGVSTVGSHQNNIRHGQPRPVENIVKDTFKLTHMYHGNQNLHICDVRSTKLIDFESITLRFQINVRLYVSIVGYANVAWKLVFRKVQSSSSLPNIDISSFEGVCFYIQNLDVLANHWEYVGCQQRFSHHNNYNRQITQNSDWQTT